MKENYSRAELIHVGVEILAEIHEMESRLEWMNHPDDVTRTKAKLAGLRRELAYVEEYLDLRRRRTPKKRKRRG